MSEKTVHQQAAQRVKAATRDATAMLMEEGLERLEAGKRPMEVADCVNEAVFFMGWWEKADGVLRAYTDAAADQESDEDA